MLTIKNQHVRPSEKKMLLSFCAFVMDYFCSPSVQNKGTIFIRFVDPNSLPIKERKELLRYRAWMTYDGVVKGKKHFTIDICKIEITSRRKTKSLVKRLKQAMLCIGHELTHVKQVLNGESFDYKNGDVRYKGKRYKNWEDEKEYYFSPWEIDAYGHELGLYTVFRMKLKEESKAK